MQMPLPLHARFHVLISQAIHACESRPSSNSIAAAILRPSSGTSTEAPPNHPSRSSDVTSVPKIAPAFTHSHDGFPAIQHSAGALLLLAKSLLLTSENQSGAQAQGPTAGADLVKVTCIAALIGRHGPVVFETSHSPRKCRVMRRASRRHCAAALAARDGSLLVNVDRARCGTRTRARVL